MKGVKVMKSINFKKLVASLLVGGTLMTGGMALAAESSAIGVTDNAAGTVSGQYLGFGYRGMNDGERPGLRNFGNQGMNEEVAVTWDLC